MRLREFAPSPDHGGGNGDFRMSWDQILDMYRQILTHTLGWRLNAGPGRSAEFTRGRAVFSIDQGLSPTIFRYRLEDTGQVLMSGFAHTLYSSVQSVLDRVKQKGIMEFAPTSRDGGEDSGWDEEERKVGPYAQRWFENPNDHPRIRNILKLQGYTVLARGWTHTEIAIQNDKTGRKMIFFDPDAIDPYE